MPAKRGYPLPKRVEEKYVMVLGLCDYGALILCDHDAINRTRSTRSCAIPSIRTFSDTAIRVGSNVR